MKQAPDVVLSASALNAPRVRLGILGPCRLAAERRVAVSDCIAIGGLAGWKYCRGVSVTERLFDEPVK